MVTWWRGRGKFWRSWFGGLCPVAGTLSVDGTECNGAYRSSATKACLILTRSEAHALSFLDGGDRLALRTWLVNKTRRRGTGGAADGLRCLNALVLSLGKLLPSNGALRLMTRLPCWLLRRLLSIIWSLHVLLLLLLPKTLVYRRGRLPLIWLLLELLRGLIRLALRRLCILSRLLGELSLLLHRLPVLVLLWLHNLPELVWLLCLSLRKLILCRLCKLGLRLHRGLRLKLVLSRLPKLLLALLRLHLLLPILSLR